MNQPLAIVENLTKRFAPDGPPALDALSFQIGGGRVTGVVGPDGAGKTTLMRLLAGLLAPSDGHLELYADLRGVVGKERDNSFERLLAFTDLARFTARLAGRLSGGMKQKLGLACAMLRSPSLLLLDEPSVGVDPISRRELWRMVKELTADGVGVVWTTAYLDEAENCAEVLVMNAGKLLFQGDPKAMTESIEHRAFLVRGAAGERRTLLTRALARPEIIDGVLQGEAVRLVMAEGANPPEPSDLMDFAAPLTPSLSPARGKGSSAAAVDKASSSPARVEGTGVRGPSAVFSREIVITPAKPRFEDAFVALLGGQPKRTQAFEAPARPSNGGGDAAVEASGLTKVFGDFTAADDISFTIKRGEIFGLLGPNGAGKSTTFKMMCGLLRPTAGTARVDGYDLYRAPAVARGRLGYMAQKFSLYGDLSVQNNLQFFGGVYGLTGAKKRDAIDRAIAAFDLAPHLKTHAAELPLGFKQRLALSCAILHNPPVLFLDEPTSGVDPLTRREFWGFINAMIGGGVTVMVTTHFMDEAEYCDRVALIYRGKSIAIGTPDELQASVKSAALPAPTLEDAFIALIEAQEQREAA
jgi:ABC-2 type transport system ATP-binding protein